MKLEKNTGENVGGCRRCGKCCREVFFVVDRAYTSDGADHMLWAEYHGLKISFRNDADGRRLWGVELKTACEHLREEADGSSICMIYEKRPQICRNYTGGHEFSECGCK